MRYKATVVAEWMLARAAREGEYLTPMKLQKLVYIAHGWHLALANGSLIFEKVEAWPWGPVIRSIYAEYAIFGSRPIDVFQPFDCEPEVEKGTEALLHRVWDVYKRFTAAQLSEMTHRENTPWSQVYEEGTKKAIPNEIIEAHYRKLAGQRSQ